jgi:choline kinase
MQYFCQHKTPSSYAIDTSIALDDEALKICFDQNNHIKKMGKALNCNTTGQAEFIGLANWSASWVNLLCERMGQVFANPKNANLYYEDIASSLIQENPSVEPISVVDIAGFDWTELDDHADLARARSLFTDLK